MSLPEDFTPTRDAAMRTLSPIEAAPPNSYFYGQRTRAGSHLPPYHLVYFLLVDLLQFPYLGEAEKVAWSVPIKIENKIYVIEHRKMGLGVFAEPGPIDEVAAEKIVSLVNAAVSKATPFFESLAEKAVKGSRVNVLNKSASLYSRFEYLRDMHKQVVGEAVSRAGERIVEEKVADFGKSATITFPAFDLQKKARRLRLGVSVQILTKFTASVVF